MKIALIFPDVESDMPDAMTPGFKMHRDGALYVATALRNAGHEVILFNETIAPVNWEELYGSDVVGLSLLALNSRRGCEIARAIRQNSSMPIIAGGVFATFSAKECLENLCDIVVRREAEDTVVELMKALETHADWRNIRGLAYLEGGQLVITEDREYPRDNNYTYAPSLLHGLNRGVFSALRDFIKTGQVRLNLIPISITRGCPHSCKFCYGVRMTGHRCRQKDISVAIREMQDIIEYTGCRRLIFTDLNFTASPAYTKRLLRSMISNKIILQQSLALSRIEVGKDAELLS